jgi:hypothetical protein
MHAKLMSVEKHLLVSGLQTFWAQVAAATGLGLETNPKRPPAIPIPIRTATGIQRACGELGLTGDPPMVVVKA